MTSSLSRELAAVELVIGRHRAERFAKGATGKRQREHDAVLTAAQRLRAGIIRRAVLAGDGAVLAKVDRAELDGRYATREPERQSVGQAIALDQIRSARGRA